MMGLEKSKLNSKLALVSFNYVQCRLFLQVYFYDKELVKG